MNQYSQGLFDTLKNILTKYSFTKDSDELTYYYFLVMRKYDPETMTVKELLAAIKKGDIEPFDSISRIRRKVQELHPETRGKNYEKRHEREIEVQTELYSKN